MGVIYHRLNWQEFGLGIEINVEFDFIRVFIGPLTLGLVWGGGEV